MIRVDGVGWLELAIFRLLGMMQDSVREDLNPIRRDLPAAQLGNEVVAFGQLVGGAARRLEIPIRESPLGNLVDLFEERGGEIERHVNPGKATK